METANYIYKILRSQLMIMFSWGFHNPRAIENGLEFCTCGFKHHGTVSVEITPLDEFRITLKKKGQVVKVIDGVYVDNLVAVIDDAVERTSDYEQRVKEIYKLRAHA
jgi:hypothetical protein